MTRVLLVEDNDAVRELLARVLEDAGYAVATATSFDAASAEIAAGGIDLLIADIVLPGGGSGIDLAARAAANGAKCVLLTGHPDWIRKDIGNGVPVFRKPFRPAALLEAIAGIA